MLWFKKKLQVFSFYLFFLQKVCIFCSFIKLAQDKYDSLAKKM